MYRSVMSRTIWEYKGCCICAILLTVVAHLATCTTLEEHFHRISHQRQKRYLTIPYGSAVGILIAFAVPIDTIQDIIISYNMEGNYNVPDQSYYFGTPPPIPELPDKKRKRSLRQFNREIAFQLLETRLESFGLNGRQCLLRLICDVNRTPVHHNGLMGQLLQIMFTPSATQSEDISSEFLLAEQYGASGGDCDRKYVKCPKNIVDMFSSVE